MVHSRQTIPSLASPMYWKDMPNGETYLRQLQMQLNQLLPRFYGQRLLKLGALSIALNTEKSSILQQIHIAPFPVDSAVDIIADYYSLPLANKSIDVCIIAHILPYIDNPHQLLREVDRVLVDDGWVILSGFNPISVLGVGKMVPFLRKRQPYACRMISQFRLIDWFSLLNYEIYEHHCYHVLPSHCKIDHYLMKGFPLLGCINFIIARKRTVPLTLTPSSQYKRRLDWKYRPVTAR